MILPFEVESKVRCRNKVWEVLKIADNGDGIEKPFLDSIFNPFFTTKYKGTGLGLATSHRIMEEHEGTITVSSRPQLGTTFKLTLPVYHA